MTDDAPRFSFVQRSQGDERAKFDFQLGEALKAEELLATIFQFAKFELKTERWQWERSGKIAIECRRGERRTGIAATAADFWVHELRIGDGKDAQGRNKYRTGCYLVVPIAVLKQLCAIAHARDDVFRGGGDGGLSGGYLLRLSRLFADLAGLSHDQA